MAHRTREDGSAEALITVAQAGALLGVHPNTVRGWTDAGRLTAWRINARGDRRYRRADVERLLQDGSVPDTARSHAAGTMLATEAELGVLARISQGTVGASSVAAVSRVVVESLRALGDEYPRVAVYLERDGQLVLETHAGQSTAPEPTKQWEGPPEGPMVEHGEVRLPLEAGGRAIGMLVVGDQEQGRRARQRMAFLESVASATVAALHSARLLTRARRELTRARALRAVTRELTGQLEPSVVLDDIVDRTRSLFDADKVGLWMVADRQHPFELAASRGISPHFQAAVAALTMDSESLGVAAVRERRSFVARRADVEATSGVLRAAYIQEQIKTACLAPLVSHERAVGVIGLYHGRDREWPDDEIALVQAFADQAAVAITNARLYRSAAERAARMRSIHDLSASLNRMTDVQAIADAIVTEASSLAAYHDIRVFTVDWERGVCEPIAYTNRLLGQGDFSDRLRVPIGAGSFTGWVAERAEAILSNDALHDGRGRTIEGTDEIEESMLVVPMVYEGRSVGVIALSKLGINQFSQDDLQTMSIFAGYAAQALVNARSYRRLEEQSAQLARQIVSQRKLLEVNERVMGTLEQADIFEVIADGLKAVVTYDNLSIYRADHERSMLVPVLTRERHAEEVARYFIPFGRGLMGWSVDHGEAVLANDALHDPRALQIPGTPPDPEALVVVPLISDGRVTGSMNVSRIGTEEVYFSETEFETVKLFAAQASIALRNADEHHAVSLRAETDSLTGLGNHGAFQRGLTELLAAAAGKRGTAGKVALLMMDLDRFKSYNDRMGHPAGDALLEAVGVALRDASGSHDHVYRYGGDEFTLALPGITRDAAQHVAEQVRLAVAALGGTARRPAVTITVGVALSPSDATEKNGLIAAADAALYHGKQAGADRVVLAAEVPHPDRDRRAAGDRRRSGNRREGRRATAPPRSNRASAA